MKPSKQVDKSCQIYNPLYNPDKHEMAEVVLTLEAMKAFDKYECYNIIMIYYLFEKEFKIYARLQKLVDAARYHNDNATYYCVSLS